MRRPELRIKQDTILTPFLCPIATVSLEDEKHSETYMKELTLIEYENLRGSGARLLGRVIPYDSSAGVIYYMVSPDQQNFCATEILDTLSLTHAPIRGQFDVIRHWTTPEVVTINYNEP